MLEYKYFLKEGGEQKLYVQGNSEERILVRKLDFHIFPCICFMYMLNHLDRANIANARIGGLESDLMLSSTDYSTVVAIFFIGYLLAEIPSNMIIARLRPSKFLSAITFLWGSVVALTGVVRSKQSLVALRFFLGFLESGFMPGVLFFLASWYRKNELTKRIGILYSSGVLAGAFSGLISGGILQNLDGALGIRGWRWLFYIEGVVTISASLIVVFFLPDWPSNTKWLSDEERVLAILRLEVEKIEQGFFSPEPSKLKPLEALMTTLKDWRTYLFSFIYLMLLSEVTISYFLPYITVTMGYTGQTAQFMTVPPYVVGSVVMSIGSASADYFDDRVFHIAVPISFSGLMYALCLRVTSPTIRYVLVCVGFGVAYSALPPLLAWVPQEMGYPDEKRAIVQAFVNAVGNCASFYGSFLWPKNQEPDFYLGFAMNSAFCFACLIACIVGELSLRSFSPSRTKVSLIKPKSDVKSL
ncbi:hypothetical protein O181_023247 [Austropuccinia psidii MF-1]|uniref:Major facilitator superfamily (MFS) profile domain-containing protein n=1 Tax=Austropuccinia psidii MF-1 TaxID=1389203 RepID=A0A9Q3CH19_9BASI|nr:hypothetical protein [Austropuccinia psidii MF-1]